MKHIANNNEWWDYNSTWPYHIWQRWGASWLRMNCFHERLSLRHAHTPEHCDGFHTPTTAPHLKLALRDPSRQEVWMNVNINLTFTAGYILYNCVCDDYKLLNCQFTCEYGVNWRYLVGRQHGIPPHMWRDSSETQGAGRWEGKRFHRRYISTHTPPLHPYSAPHSSVLQVNSPLQTLLHNVIKGLVYPTIRTGVPHQTHKPTFHIFHCI